MATPEEIKSRIYQDVTSKTLPFSIDNVDVGEIMRDTVDLAKDLNFTTTADRIAYLSQGSPGQIGYDKQDGNLYFINANGSQWVFLSSTNGNFEVIPFVNQSSLIVSWTANRKTRFGLGVFTVEILGDDGKYRQSQVEVIPDNISSTSQYSFDFGGNQTGRLIIK